MGFFSRLLGDKKDEDEAVRPPVRQETPPVAREEPRRRFAPPSTSTPEERERIKEIVSKSLDEFSDAVGEMIETGDWRVGGKVPAAASVYRFRNVPFADEKGDLLRERVESLGIAEKTWGGYDRSWNARDAANRYYEIFPRDINEVKKYITTLAGEITADTGDDALYVKALQYALAYNTNNVDREVSELLPAPSSLQGDAEGIMWHLNSDGFGPKKAMPMIDNEVNWLATLRESAAGIKKDLEGIDDGVLRTMLSNYLDEQNDLMTRMYMRFSGCGQRVQRMREAFVMWYGVPKPENGLPGHELQDYAYVREHLLHYSRVWYCARKNAKGEEHARDAEVDKEYHADNDDFASTSLSMRRVYAILSMCCCMKYALDNLVAYHNFAFPIIKGSMDRHITDVKNYLSFRGYTDDADPGKKYHEVFEKVKAHTFNRHKELTQAMVHYLKGNRNITDSIAYSAMYIARTHEPDENRIRWGLSDALWRRMDPCESIPITTSEFRYFVPWSVKPGELLELGGVQGGQQSPGDAR